ncbi:MAG: GSU2403 family nucleotidyltransferase fold protein [Hyphomicrobiaceae bacterium]
MNLTELTNEQRRQLIDVRQAFSAWRTAARKTRHIGLRWVTRKGAEYLYRKSQKSERSLGRRSPATEATMAEHIELRNRVRQSAARLKSMARVNRALYLNRVPKDPTLILRELDAAGLLGQHMFVIGTNALYAYEMRSGVLFESSLLATGDFDLLWDARDRLRLLVSGISPEGVLGILRRADPTFSTADNYGTRAQNASGYFVDLFCPDLDPAPERITPTDLDPITTEGADWLVEAPKIEETVIGWDGIPLNLPCVDPRVFALHKLWLSQQPSRQPASKPRDKAQAYAVAAVASSYLNLKFNDRSLARLPAELKAGAAELAKAAKTITI